MRTTHAPCKPPIIRKKSQRLQIGYNIARHPMFKSRLFKQKPLQVISADRYREVELAVVFKKVHCYACGFEAIYKYRVQQVRRRPEIQVAEGEEIRSDHQQIWLSIPRFAEIPETVRCKKCSEVLGLEPTLVY